MNFASKKAYLPRRQRSLVRIELDLAQEAQAEPEEAKEPAKAQSEASSSSEDSAEQQLPRRRAKKARMLNRCSSDEALSISDGDMNASFQSRGPSEGEEEQEEVKELIQEAKGKRPEVRANRRFKEKVDTNVICIGLHVLQNIQKFATGDPAFCQGCQAVLSCVSVVEEEAGRQLWTCEFCGFCNQMNLEPEEMPSQFDSSMDFILESPAQAAEASLGPGGEPPVLFCIGISVSVITIEGEEASIENLQKLALQTEGDVQRVDPLQIANNFANILSTPILASHVKVVLRLHRGLTFRGADFSISNQSTVEKEIGNVTQDSEVTFQYGMKKEEQLIAEGVHMSALQSLPFQTVIYFTRPNGMRCMRVLTDSQAVTDVREEAEQEVNLDVLAVNCAQNAATFAQAGDYRAAQSNAVAWKKVMKKHVNTDNVESYNKFARNMDQLHEELQGVQQEEFEEQGQFQSESMRAAVRKDKLAHMMFHGKKANKEKCLVF